MGISNTRTNEATYFKQYQRDYYKCLIAIGKSQSYYRRQSCLGFGNIPPLGSRSLKHLRYLSHGGGYPRWTHIQFRWLQTFLLFYFYSFNIVFEDKPSTVLIS